MAAPAAKDPSKRIPCELAEADGRLFNGAPRSVLGPDRFSDRWHRRWHDLSRGQRSSHEVLDPQSPRVDQRAAGFRGHCYQRTAAHRPSARGAFAHMEAAAFVHCAAGISSDGALGLPRFSRRDVRGAVPVFARVGLHGPSIALSAEITCWSPFSPGDTDNASLPVAGLEYRLTNHNRQQDRCRVFLQLRECDGQTTGSVGPDLRALRPCVADYGRTIQRHRSIMRGFVADIPTRCRCFGATSPTENAMHKLR